MFTVAEVKMRIKKYKKVIYAFIHSIVLLIIVNVFANSSFSFGEERGLVRSYNFILQYLGLDDELIDSGTFLVDVSYDRSFTPVYDEYGMPMGDAVITDRNKLLRFLSVLHQTNTYKYIIFDIHIDPEVKTDYDTLLIDKINVMDRIVVPYHKDSSNTLIKSDKKGLADYSIMYSNADFSKYTFVENNFPSMAQRMYDELNEIDTPNSFCGFLNTDKGLAYKNLLIRLPYHYNNRYDEHGELIIHSLGADVLESYDSELLQEVVRNKIVVLGSFDGSDMHSTYVGDLAGPLLHLNAYHALERGEHLIHYGLQIIMFLLFFVISLCLFGVIKSEILITDLIHNKRLLYVLSFVSYSTILFLFSMTCFLFTGQVVEIMMLSLWFSIVQFSKNHILK